MTNDVVSPEEAAARLIFHARSEPGAFLDMLRPYRGVREDVLQDVQESLRLSMPLFEKPPLGRELVSALWAISYYGRFWALDPNGMLQRNQLIADADLERMKSFLARFDWAIANILDGSPAAAFTTPPTLYGAR
jgi:hypothetical protein